MRPEGPRAGRAQALAGGVARGRNARQPAAGARMITWLPPTLLGASGRLGLAHSPGSRQRSRDDELDEFVAAGVQHVICLQEAYEFSQRPLDETLDERRTAVETRGMRFTHEPIPDMAAPTLARTQRIVSALGAELALGRSVVVHCWAGLGRAGTIAACALIDAGHGPQLAVALLRDLRPGAVQSLLQERHVRQFADAVRATRGGS